MEFHHVTGAAGLAYGQGDGRREFASQPLPGVLASLRAQVQEHLDCVFENVSANHYRHGGDHVGWHADDGPTMCNSRPIAVLSLGAKRSFAYRHREERGPGTVLSVESGDLLVMPAGMQQTHVHKLLKANTPLQRICVVFRGIRS
ncbi:alpha-ketoglutarate-dependent dioxygenase AlkB [Comamonas thiooxydans]|uniref:alpha-ketoglutarate-dependent dioxygenase AlkB n=1 Tax=Comamonas thiooxydans TaxID=363952 RepID=UPI00341A0587